MFHHDVIFSYVNFFLHNLWPIQICLLQMWESWPHSFFVYLKFWILLTNLVVNLLITIFFCPKVETVVGLWQQTRWTSDWKVNQTGWLAGWLGLLCYVLGQDSILRVLVILSGWPWWTRKTWQWRTTCKYENQSLFIFILLFIFQVLLIGYNTYTVTYTVFSYKASTLNLPST